MSIPVVLFSRRNGKESHYLRTRTAKNKKQKSLIPKNGVITMPFLGLYPIEMCAHVIVAPVQ